MGAPLGDFFAQRVDFSLDTSRGFKLVIEIDGAQHDQFVQKKLDDARARALETAGWDVWRVRTSALRSAESLQALREQLKTLVEKRTPPALRKSPDMPRDHDLMTGVWGPTVVSRIQFFVLEALKDGHLPWTEAGRVRVVESETRIGDVALADLSDWFGRLAALFRLAPFGGQIPAAAAVEEGCDPDLIIDLSVTNAHRPLPVTHCPLAWSRPANRVGAFLRTAIVDVDIHAHS